MIHVYLKNLALYNLLIQLNDELILILLEYNLRYVQLFCSAMAVFYV